MEKKLLYEIKYLFWIEMINKICLYRVVLIEVIFDVLK